MQKYLRSIYHMHEYSRSRKGPWAHVGRALVSTPGPLWAGRLWAPRALVGGALMGPPGPCRPPWALVGALGPLWARPGPLWARSLHDGLAPVAATIGHCPRDDRRRHRNWIWLCPGQLQDDPRSMSIKGGDIGPHDVIWKICTHI